MDCLVTAVTDEVDVPRRLLQDFVTAPVPYAAMRPLALSQPSRVPGWIEGAMWSPPIPDLARKASTRRRVELHASRERVDGWSTRVGWPGGLRGFPAFDGELLLHGIDDDTFIGLQGAVSLAEASMWTERELREARVQLRGLLTNMSKLVAHDLRFE